MEEESSGITEDQVQDLLRRLAALEVSFHVSRRFIMEIEGCLRARLFLAALLVSPIVLEMIVRETLIKKRYSSKRTGKRIPSVVLDEIDREAEVDKSLTFSRIAFELYETGVISDSEHKSLRSVYQRVRIPLQHGLVGRYVEANVDAEMLDIWETLGFLRSSRTPEFEENLEATALVDLEEVVRNIEAVVAKGAV